MQTRINELQHEQHYIHETSLNEYQSNLIKQDFYQLQQENGDIFSGKTFNHIFLSLISEPAQDSLQFIQECEFRIQMGDQLTGMSNRVQKLKQKYMQQRESIITSKITLSEMVMHLRQQDEDLLTDVQKNWGQAQSMQLYEAIDQYFTQLAPRIPNQSMRPSTSSTDDCMEMDGHPKILQIKALTQSLHGLLHCED